MCKAHRNLWHIEILEYLIILSLNGLSCIYHDIYLRVKYTSEAGTRQGPSYTHIIITFQVLNSLHVLF